MPTCQQCGQEMRKAKRTSGHATGCLLCLLGVSAGVIVFIFIPVIGWVLGPLIVLVSLFVGGKTEKIWKCNSCKTLISRA